MQSIRNIPPQASVFAVALCCAQIPLVAFRWRSIISGMLDRRLMPSWARVVEITWIGQFFGQVLPFIAGDAVRILLLQETGPSARVAIKSTLFDRGIALIGLFAIALPSAMFSPIMNNTGRYKLPLQLFVVSGCAGILLLLIAAQLAHGLSPWLGPVKSALDEVADLSWLLTTRTGAVVCSLCLAVHGLSVLIFWILAKAEGVSLGPFDVLAIVPLVLIVMTVPASIAGWGLREGFVVAIFGASGLPAEKTLLLSISFGVVNLLASLPGSILTLALNRWGNSPTPVQAAPE
jgi:glycosyltransferase 2 family protein